MTAKGERCGDHIVANNDEIILCANLVFYFHFVLRLENLDFFQYLPREIDIVLHSPTVNRQKMGVPSSEASNAIIYLTYGAFLHVLQYRLIGSQCRTDYFTQYLWSYYSLAAPQSIQSRIPVEQPYTKRSATTVW